MSTKNKEDREEIIGGLLFIACMFIGAGIGMLFGHTAPGGAIGMGVGFLLMALIKQKKTPVEFSPPRTIPSVILFAIGIIIIAVGICLLISPELLYPYLASFALIVIGALIISIGVLSYRKS